MWDQIVFWCVLSGKERPNCYPSLTKSSLAGATWKCFAPLRAHATLWFRIKNGIVYLIFSSKCFPPFRRLAISETTLMSGDGGGRENALLPPSLWSGKTTKVRKAFETLQRTHCYCYTIHDEQLAYVQCYSAPKYFRLQLLYLSLFTPSAFPNQFKRFPLPKYWQPSSHLGSHFYELPKFQLFPHFHMIHFHKSLWHIWINFHHLSTLLHRIKSFPLQNVHKIQDILGARIPNSDIFQCSTFFPVTTFPKHCTHLTYLHPPSTFLKQLPPLQAHPIHFVRYLSHSSMFF